jgi:hypothetical protein
VAYVQPFPGPGERVPVSSVSGRRLGWTARGDGLLTASESGVFGEGYAATFDIGLDLS